MAEKRARDLADRGLAIVSGLVREIDSSAHQAALSSSTGASVGVLRCGIDVIYPQANKKISRIWSSLAQLSPSLRWAHFLG
jgi:DNA processing protein